MDSRFNHANYLVKKQVLKLVGGGFRVYGPDGSLVFYSRMKAFKLREDIRLYTGEDMQTEVLSIKARQIMDISATYDVIDTAANQKIGALRRKGLKSIIRDEWIVLDGDDREIGAIKEDGLALLRRFINLIPQSFHAEVKGVTVCTFKQNFNPFTLRLAVDFAPESALLFDRRLGIAAAILLCAIEGRQSN